MKSYLKEAIIAALVGIILYQHACVNGRMRVLKEPEAEVITKTEIIRDTVIREIPVPVPSPSDSVFVQVPIWADTTRALQTFYNKYFYKQQLADSNLIITISDSISQNRIIDRDFSYQILRPTEINTTEIHPPADTKAQVLIGMRIGGSKTELTSFSPEIEYISKNYRAYGIAYNFSSSSVELSIKWPLSGNK